MVNTKPSDLNEQEWQLLQHLSQYAAPFSLDFVYSEFINSQTDKPSFYRSFYRLIGLLYIQLNGVDEEASERKRTFYYILTPKGRKTVASYTQSGEDELLSDCKTT